MNKSISALGAIYKIIADNAGLVLLPQGGSIQ
jgi:hypothetical protein